MSRIYIPAALTDNETPAQIQDKNPEVAHMHFIQFIDYRGQRCALFSDDMIRKPPRAYGKDE